MKRSRTRRVCGDRRGVFTQLKSTYVETIVKREFSGVFLATSIKKGKGLTNDFRLLQDGVHGCGCFTKELCGGGLLWGER